MSGEQDNGTLDKLKKGYQPAKPADDQSVFCHPRSVLKSLEIVSKHV